MSQQEYHRFVQNNIAASIAIASLRESFELNEPGLDDWRPIADAPRNMLVWLANDQMDHPVIGRKSCSHKYHELVADPLEKLLPMPAGGMVCATHWAPVKPIEDQS